MFALLVVSLGALFLSGFGDEMHPGDAENRESLSARLGQLPNLAELVQSDSIALGSSHSMNTFTPSKLPDTDSRGINHFKPMSVGKPILPVKPHAPFVIGKLKVAKAPIKKKALAIDAALIKKKVGKKLIPKLKVLPLAKKPKITKLEPIVYVINKPVPVYHKVPIPKKIPIPKLVPIMKPIPVPKIIPVPYKVPVVKIIPKIVKVPKAIPVPKIVPIKKKIPIGIPVPVPKIHKVPVLKPVPFLKPIPIPVPKLVPKFVPVPVKKVIKVPKPYYVPVKVPVVTKSYVKMPTIVPVPTKATKPVWPSKFKGSHGIPSSSNFPKMQTSGHFGSGQTAFGAKPPSLFQQSQHPESQMNFETLLAALDAMQK